MLKFGLVGCGRIAKRHSELLGHNQINNASLVAVCDIDEEKAKKIGEQFNVPYYTDMDEMIRLIKDAGKIPVLRDSLYREIKRF